MGSEQISVVSAEEARARGLREGVEASAGLGAFEVVMWWPRGATGGPHELVIRPREDADPREVERGITTGTLRNVPLIEQTEAVRELLRKVEATVGDAEVNESIRRIRKTIEDMPNPGRAGRPNEFYLWVSLVYAHLAKWGDKPIQELADKVGVSAASVKTWVRAARNAGMLSEASESRPGGQLTPRARRLLEGVTIRSTLR